ncbi:helix-turn-helix domain-containing protein [Mycobacteroides chelonae]|uniref:helix-turn-helix domain-containing protein n=1 Tax=Mycobacteroides chelonae TaxID=1774 RepID=UPI0039E96123
MDQIEHELLTVVETAAVRRCSVETLRRRIRDGSLPVVRQGRTVLIRRTDALAGDPQ